MVPSRRWRGDVAADATLNRRQRSLTGWKDVLERVIVIALLFVLLLVVASVWFSRHLVSPAVEAADAVNELEDHLLSSHLAFEGDVRTPSEEAVLGPLDDARRLCAETLADVHVDDQARSDRAHPCDSLPALQVAAAVDLERTRAGIAGHAAYDEAIESVLADASALDASLTDAVTEAFEWVRVVQTGEVVLLGGLVVLIGVTVRAHRQATEELTAALRHEATHDALTGLRNRLELHRVLESATGRHGHVTLLFLDLDGFKVVNDTIGHSTGDALLVAIADRLRRLARPDDTVVRLGGDEFAVVCPGVDEAAAPHVAERIVTGLRRPVLADDQAVAVSASVGFTSDRADRISVTDLERQADIAMYVAKAHGGDRAERYRPEMHAEILERRELGDDLAVAVAGGGIDVVYQPIVEIATGRVHRVEALARWRHPVRGPVPPDVFIGLAESGSLISALGGKVLHRACTDLRAWQQQFPEAADVGVAVNVSTMQLITDGFVDTVASALSSTGLAAEHLTIEITEGALAGHAQAEAIIGQLRGVGVRIAIDDFGTGHSSLSRLRDLHVHELKIDRSFITPVGDDPAAEPLVVSILALARSLHLEVVAEGVETPSQFAFLGEHGCDLAQGYLLSKPRTVQECAELWSGSAVDAMPEAGRARGARSEADTSRHQPLDGLLEPLDAEEDTASRRAALRRLLAKLTDLTGLDTAYLTRIDWEGGIQHIDSAYNATDPAISEGLTVPWRDTVCRRMLTRGPAATDDVPGAFADSPAARDLELQTYVGVPVLGGDGQLYGTLCAASRERHPVGQDTIRLMEVFAALASNHLIPPPA